MPQMGFCAVYRPPGTPYGRQKSGIFIFCVEFQGGQHIKKSATGQGAKRVIFGKNMFFFNFSRFLRIYRISVYISIIYAPKEESPYINRSARSSR